MQAGIHTELPPTRHGYQEGRSDMLGCEECRNFQPSMSADPLGILHECHESVDYRVRRLLQWHNQRIVN